MRSKGNKEQLQWREENNDSRQIYVRTKMSEDGGGQWPQRIMNKEAGSMMGKDCRGQRLQRARTEEGGQEARGPHKVCHPCSTVDVALCCQASITWLM